MPPEVISETMLPVALKMANDPVPNIRFNVAKALGTIIPLVDSQNVQQEIKPCLTNLQEDEDSDVKFFATQALLKC